MKRFFFPLAFLLLAVAIPAQAALQIQSWQLANGARVLFVENHSIPLVDVSIEFDAGSRRDPPGKAGTAALTHAMLARGVSPVSQPLPEPALSEAQISDTLADTAAQRGGDVSADRAGLTLRSLRSEREAALSLFARLLAHPSFPAELLARDKARAISSLKEDETKPEVIASKAFWRLLYGQHPYAQQESVASLEAITREDVAAFHRMHYVANRAVIALIGDLSRTEAETIAQQLTLRLPQGAPLPALPAVQLSPIQEERIAHPASQAHILSGMPAVTRGDPDYFALLVGNYILGGGGFVSRLTQEIREKRGLSYSASSYFSPLAQLGPFQAGFQTQREQTAMALKVMRETIAAFLRDGPSAQELQAAKGHLIGGFALRIDSNKKILDNIAMMGFYQLPLDYLETWTTQVGQVTQAQIQAAFKRKIALDRMATVIVGDVPP